LLAESRECTGHRAAAYAGLRAIDPCLLGRETQVVHVAERARDLVAELVTEVARALDVPDPLALLLHRRRDAVAGRPRAREFARLRRLEQRQPVIAGIDLRGLLRGARDRRLELEPLVAGAAFHGRRIDEPVAAHPDPVRG